MKRSILFGTQVTVGDVEIPLASISIKDLRAAFNMVTNQTHTKFDLNRVNILEVREIGKLGEMFAARDGKETES